MTENEPKRPTCRELWQSNLELEIAMWKAWRERVFMKFVIWCLIGAAAFDIIKKSGIFQ